MPTSGQTTAYAYVSEALVEEGYSSGNMLTPAEIRDALVMMAAEGERLVAFEQTLRAKLDEVDEDAELDTYAG